MKMMNPTTGSSSQKKLFILFPESRSLRAEELAQGISVASATTVPMSSLMTLAMAETMNSARMKYQ
jgi:hypothetical protein